MGIGGKALNYYLPWRNSRPYERRLCLPQLKYKIKMAPHQSTRSCGPETVLLKGIYFDSTAGKEYKIK
jgi:hypothetical protein